MERFYDGSFVYKNNELHFMSQPEGYVKYDSGTNSFSYVYQFKNPHWLSFVHLSGACLWRVPTSIRKKIVAFVMRLTKTEVIMKLPFLYHCFLKNIIFDKMF